ncbi:hypothetical protein [Aurantiacibacter spongiae]|uniref:RecA-like protein n=1 Tax=Aurantiacibacter spongiae TaxID=2488860 RepID=A0A3N5CPB7_9SPHN|nr:hypothetical protein [Aurantiacibacter spongiae]RPF70417.1 hypothetical protein EG799_01330 [Aurantiacibacter spongiae]
MDLATLPKAAELASVARNPRWRPAAGLALHSEIFAPGNGASGAGAAVALALDGLSTCKPETLEERSVLWVQDARSRKLTGRPYRAGLPETLRHRLIHVCADTPEDALFALEEGMRCRDLAFVIGEIAGNPRALDFTASRRLSLAAEKHGVPLYLVRLDATPDLSSARMRWRMRGAPSAPPRWNIGAPGKPAWSAELFRARGYAPGEWTLREDGHVLAAEPPLPASRSVSEPAPASAGGGEGQATASM